MWIQTAFTACDVDQRTQTNGVIHNDVRRPTHTSDHGPERSDVESWKPVAQAVADDHVFPHQNTERDHPVLADDGHHIYR